MTTVGGVDSAINTALWFMIINFMVLLCFTLNWNIIVMEDFWGHKLCSLSIHDAASPSLEWTENELILIQILSVDFSGSSNKLSRTFLNNQTQNRQVAQVSRSVIMKQII